RPTLGMKCGRLTMSGFLQLVTINSQCCLSNIVNFRALFSRLRLAKLCLAKLGIRNRVCALLAAGFNN
ncbi:hypothetical protein, partial [Pseudoalteromonas sp. S2893]|uniref:hypothetical protein n=1 Tax=Pseudoalteromonas sp. S2893 TaxID=579530 RepID=UPI001BB2BA6F